MVAYQRGIAVTFCLWVGLANSVSSAGEPWTGLQVLRQPGTKTDVGVEEGSAEAAILKKLEARVRIRVRDMPLVQLFDLIQERLEIPDSYRREGARRVRNKNGPPGDRRFRGHPYAVLAGTGPRMVRPHLGRPEREASRHLGRLRRERPSNPGVRPGGFPGDRRGGIRLRFAHRNDHRNRRTGKLGLRRRTPVRYCPWRHLESGHSRLPRHNEFTPRSRVYWTNSVSDCPAKGAVPLTLDST